MTNARRKDDVVVDVNWITNLGRFDVKTIAIFVALIVWLSSLQFGGANDSTARADVVKVEKAAAVHQAQADGRWDLVIQRLDDVKKQNDELKVALEKLNEKLDKESK